MANRNTRVQLTAAVRAQETWIETHGRTIAGYIALYGNHGADLYRADWARLLQLKQQLVSCQ